MQCSPLSERIRISLEVFNKTRIGIYQRRKNSFNNLTELMSNNFLSLESGL